MIKKYLFSRESKHLDPLVLITDSDTSEWVSDDEGNGCVGFLLGVDFDSEDFFMSAGLPAKCIEMDSQHYYQEYREILTDKDIQDFDYVSGNLHDEHISECLQADDTIHILFDDVWGCKIEMWFEGDTSFCIESREPPNNISEWWSCSSIIRENGFFYLVDDELTEASAISDDYCWFKGRALRYKVIPN